MQNTWKQFHSEVGRNNVDRYWRYWIKYDGEKHHNKISESK